jgi:hypothetical protein
LRTLFVAFTVLAVWMGMTSAVYRYWFVKSQEREARAEIHPYGGVFSMASALYSIRTGGRSKGWFFVTFLNYVEAVDLSPHNWSAKERRGTLLRVDDNAVAVLRKFSKLRSLDLRDTHVTDGAVQHIKSLQHLERLDIRGTQITDDGFKQLMNALPNCEILR